MHRIALWLLCFIAHQAFACIEVRVEGVASGAEHNVKLAIRALDYLRCDPKVNPLHLKHALKNSIRSALKPYGYFDPILSWQDHDPTHWTAKITPGPRVRLGDISLTLTTPAPPVSEKALWDHIHLRTNDPLNVTRYENTLNHLTQRLERYGYLNAESSQSHLVIDVPQQRANVHIIIHPNHRFYLDTLNIHSTTLAPSFVKRFLKTRPHSPFLPEIIARDQQVLNASGYFKKVQFKRLKTTKDHKISMHIHTQPYAKRYQMIGMGYDTDLGLQGVGGIKWRYLNPYGHQFKLSGRLGSHRSQLESQYVVPLKDPAHDKLTFQATLETDLDQDFAKSRYLDLSTDFWHQSRRHNIHFGLIYKREHTFPQTSESYRSRLVYPEVEWRYRYLKPHFEWIWSQKLRGGQEQFFSDVSFAQWQTQSMLRFGLEDPWRLWLQSTLGFTHVKRISDLPLSLQFATGGAQTLRGYAYQSIGPGRVLKLASLSIQRRLHPNVYLSAFIDAGNATEHLRDAWKKSIGVGTVWSLPIGQCSFSIARPLHAHNHRWRLHLSFAL